MENLKDTFSIKNTNSYSYPFRSKEQESDVQTVSEEVPVYKHSTQSNEEKNDVSVYDVAAYIVRKTGKYQQ